MASFEPAPEGVLVHLEEHEADLLRQLLGELGTLLDADIRVDPVNQRLFPDPYDTDEDSAAYHQLVGDDLRTDKTEALRRVQAAVGPNGALHTSLSADEAGSWLPVLTDIRLAIGTRNDVTEEMMSRDVDPEDPEQAGLLVLHWLGWLQESLLKALKDSA